MCAHPFSKNSDITNNAVSFAMLSHIWHIEECRRTS